MTTDLIPHVDEYDDECSCGIDEVTPVQQLLLTLFDDWYGDKSYRKHREISGWADELTKPLLAELSSTRAQLAEVTTDRDRLAALITVPDGSDIPEPLLAELLALANHAEGLDVADYELLDHHRTETYRTVIESAWSVARESIDDLTADRDRLARELATMTVTAEERQDKIEHLLRAVKHECSEIGNAMGGYDCVCGSYWSESSGGCTFTPKEQGFRIKAAHDAAVERGQRLRVVAIPAPSAAAVSSTSGSAAYVRDIGWPARLHHAAAPPAEAARCSSRYPDSDGITLYPCVADNGHDGLHWSRNRVREWATAEQYDMNAVPPAEVEQVERLCSDKNGFHDPHEWRPDPYDDNLWCPGYPAGGPTW